jgi:glycosyltransferase involved in cell wall biosynthesis
VAAKRAAMALRAAAERRTWRAAGYAARRALSLDLAAGVRGRFDIAIATSFGTALPALRLNAGRRFYLAQHYEPLFAQDFADPWLAELEARATYHLGMRMIANSSWLRSRLMEEAGCADVALCPPGIDHSQFFGAARRRRPGEPVTIVSYGGRGASWKGFAEMAEAVRIVRARAGLAVRWRVFGRCALPPDNGVARYEPLGFLRGEALRRAYSEADLLLSASWYESFPLYPIEAMACGVAVVTTQAGTEEYAADGVTAVVVPARDPQGIAEGVLRLIAQPDYAFGIAERGQAASQAFTWPAAVDRLNRLLAEPQFAAVGAGLGAQGGGDGLPA